jgi:hypothetical protein
MKCDIRIIAECRENQSSVYSPIWILRGNVEFIIRGVDDIINEFPLIGEDVMRDLLYVKSNETISYKLIRWEVIQTSDEMDNLWFNTNLKSRIQSQL